MDDQRNGQVGDPPTDPVPLVQICTSCYTVQLDDQHCVCLIERAQTVAREQHELRRIDTPAWRRPRPWDALSTRARQDATANALCLVAALDSAGWRLVTTTTPGRHVLSPVSDVVQ